MDFKFILILFTSILIRMIQNISMKRKVLYANNIFNEQNVSYINRNEESGTIEYKSNTIRIYLITFIISIFIRWD